jgi:uncharacterized protein
VPFQVIPRELVFYDLLEAAARNVVDSTGELVALVDEVPSVTIRAEQIRDLEHRGDDLTHQIISTLNQTFVVPLDRHDILRLASALDDIVDFIEETADFMSLYRIEAPMDKATEMASILHQSSRAVAGAIPRLRTFKDIHHYTIEVNRLENEGDRVVRGALASLFERGIDPMTVIRWKDIYERLEDGIDATESAANILEGIVIKNT